MVFLSFVLHPNRVDLGRRTVDVLLLKGAGRVQLRLTLEERAGEYSIALWARHQTGATELVGRATATPRHAVTLGVEWRRATGPGHENGVARLLRNGRVVAESTNRDTDRVVIADLRLGLPSGCKRTAAGSFLLDEITLHH